MIQNYLKYYPKLMEWTEPWTEMQVLLCRLGMPARVEVGDKDDRHVMLFSLRKPPHHVLFHVTAWPSGKMRFGKNRFHDQQEGHTKDAIESAVKLEVEYRQLKRQGYRKTGVHPRMLERLCDL